MGSEAGYLLATLEEATPDPSTTFLVEILARKFNNSLKIQKTGSKIQKNGRGNSKN